ncbi:hypothetical protein KaCgl_07730 [Corynebacterium glutamicum]|nr:hypothetical protein KaCgl_07730 [Corynebacterium glutamicum]
MEGDAEAVDLQARLSQTRGNPEASDALVAELTGVTANHPLVSACLKFPLNPKLLKIS